jgi:RNA polymerase sigma-70 factor (ECF subfamily)
VTEPPKVQAPPWDVSLSYGAHRDGLFASVLRSTHDAELAADIVQEAFLRLILADRRGALPENELAWLRRVVGNLVIDLARRRATRVARSPHRDESPEAPETAVLRREAQHELHVALGVLSPDARRALLLEGEGYRPAEIATIFGKSPEAMRTLLCRARQRLRPGLAGLAEPVARVA